VARILMKKGYINYSSPKVYDEEHEGGSLDSVQH
jgi:hypothetical protein